MDNQVDKETKAKFSAIKRYKKRLWKARKRERKRVERCERQQKRRELVDAAGKAEPQKSTDRHTRGHNNAEKKDVSVQATTTEQRIVAVPDSRGKHILKAALGKKNKESTVNQRDTEIKTVTATKRAATESVSLSEVAKKKSKQPLVKELNASLVLKVNDAGTLGSGTFGTCFLAKYRDISVAVKEYHDNKERSSLSSLQKSAFREARIIMELGDHPGLPLLFGVCTQTKPVQLVLKFHGNEKNCTSDTIYSATKKSPPLEKKSWQNIFKLTAVALKHIHDCGIIHNDLKANNVVLEQNEHPVIIDFGRSVRLSEAKPRSQHLPLFLREGKNSYIAPEIHNGTGKPSASSDVFSFAKMIDFVSKRCKCYRSSAVTKALANKPSERPPLEDIIREYSVPVQ